MYHRTGWEIPCRFVAMRLPKELKDYACKPMQYELFDNDRYTYRTLCTSLSGRPHKVIMEYNKRAHVQNLVGESKREGLEAIPSA